jgi:purine-nucleoside phosphorylase
VVWSTDALLRETSALVNHWAKHGVIGVDMEAGALFTVARLLGLRAVSILVASDNPFLGVETDVSKLSTGMRAAIDLALEFAARVSLTA